jgi:DNA-directed RNA polymerase subunit RPC12/RpoP
VLETVLLLAVMAALAVVSWAVAYRQIPVRQTVAETGSKMGITCPRCGLAQEVTLPEGECAGCRLRILVSLEGDEVKG